MRFIILILILGFFTAGVLAEDITPAPKYANIMQAQNVSFEDCYKIYPINKEALFNLVLCGISANKFNVEEIRTSSGYIIFTAAKRQYLATICEIDNNNSMLKITPCNNVYIFQPGIVLNMFKYIELNQKAKLKF